MAQDRRSLHDGRFTASGCQFQETNPIEEAILAPARVCFPPGHHYTAPSPAFLPGVIVAFESDREFIMSNPHDSADFHQDELQFDEAEFTEPSHAVTTCTACQTPIADLYYEAGGKIVCDPCQHKLEAMFHGGSPLGRALKAFVMGAIAAAAGAV